MNWKQLERWRSHDLNPSRSRGSSDYAQGSLPEKIALFPFVGTEYVEGIGAFCL
jgi:hypothetical protein